MKTKNSTFIIFSSKRFFLLDAIKNFKINSILCYVKNLISSFSDQLELNNNLILKNLL